MNRRDAEVDPVTGRSPNKLRPEFYGLRRSLYKFLLLCGKKAGRLIGRRIPMSFLTSEHFQLVWGYAGAAVRQVGHDGFAVVG